MLSTSTEPEVTIKFLASAAAVLLVFAAFTLPTSMSPPPDISNPHEPRLVDAVEVPQPNMMKLSPDSKRLYVTNSILSSLDGDVRFGAWLFHVGSEGMLRDESFDPNFNGFDTGPAGPHDMLLK